MENNKVIILVATHKPDKVYQDNVYTPIHVGRTISKYKNEMAGMIGDDTGDNISSKNPMFCELTAQYWAWKNLESVEYIGFCHYRRYFETQITNENIDQLLGKKYDVILPRPIIATHYVKDRLLLDSCKEDFYIFISTLLKLYPEYKQTVYDYLFNNRVIAYNMFICKKELFNRYASWLFSILFEAEKKVKLSGYTRMRRVFGYYGEAFLAIYMLHNKHKILFDDIVSMPGTKTLRESMIKEFLYNIKFKIKKLGGKQIITSDNDAVQVGLKNDGIEI